MAKKEDVRIIKTRERLRDALIILLKEKSINDISILDICRQSGVNRNTFYFHYDNIYTLFDDVILDTSEYFLSFIEEKKKNGENAQNIITSILEEFMSDRIFFSQLFSGEEGLKAIKRVIERALCDSLANINGISDLITRKDFIDFLLGGVISMIFSFLKEPKIETKDAGAKICFFAYSLRPFLYR